MLLPVSTSAYTPTVTTNPPNYTRPPPPPPHFPPLFLPTPHHTPHHAATVQEKATRGTLKSAVERAISKRTMVILDSINNIKVVRGVHVGWLAGGWVVCWLVLEALCCCHGCRCVFSLAALSQENTLPLSTSYSPLFTLLSPPLRFLFIFVSRQNKPFPPTTTSPQGYRYELWCVARAAGTRYCMVHVATPTDTCREWNTARPEAERYTDAV